MIHHVLVKNWLNKTLIYLNNIHHQQIMDFTYTPGSLGFEKEKGRI